MKKFSSMTNTNKKEKVLENNNNNKIDIKYAINHLMEEFLRTAIYGPIDPILEGTIKIEGKEDFINALLDFIKTDEIKDQIKLLEKVRHFGIDNYLNNLESLNEKYSLTPSEKTKHIKRINDLIKKSENNISKLIDMAERQAERIETPEKAFHRGVTAESLIGSDRVNNKFLKEIARIFKFRAKQLGYTL